MATQSHESLTSFRKVTISSERRFGVTVGLILAVLAVWPLIRHHQPVRLWLLVIAAVLVGLGLVAPKLLAPVNKLWFRFGLLLTAVTNPIVMGIMYFAAVVPLAWFIRLRGHDLLRLRRDAAADSYWIERDHSATAPLTKQF